MTRREQRVVDAVACPACGSPAGRGCVLMASSLLPVPYAQTVHASRQYAARDVVPLPDTTAEKCDHTWTGPTGVIWDCTGTVHPTDPTRGNAGSGHTLVARGRIA